MWAENASLMTGRKESLIVSALIVVYTIIMQTSRSCRMYDGKYEMAADVIESAEAKFPGSNSLKRAKRFVYLKLMEKNQNTDPFKFIIYSGRIGEQTPQINSDK
jgi:hypothetical protein